MPTDITNPEQVATLMQKAVNQFDKIDVSIHTVKVGILKQYDKLEPPNINYLLDVNLKESFYTCQAATNVMKESKSGHIGNVVGVLGKHSTAWHSRTVPPSTGLVDSANAWQVS